MLYPLLLFSRISLDNPPPYFCKLSAAAPDGVRPVSALQMFRGYSCVCTPRVASIAWRKVRRLHISNTPQRNTTPTQLSCRISSGGSIDTTDYRDQRICITSSINPSQSLLPTDSRYQIIASANFNKTSHRS